MLSDTEIVKQLNKNNREIIRHLFDNYYLELYRFALKLVHAKEVAEEIVDDIFVNIWNNRQKIEIKSSLKAYLYASVRFGALNYFRDNKNRLSQTDDVMPDLPFNETPLDKIQEGELSRVLTDAIQSLPEKCRAIFSLSRNSDLTYKQIAGELNISVKTVENQMSIALKKIREFLMVYNK